MTRGSARVAEGRAGLSFRSTQVYRFAPLASPLLALHQVKKATRNTVQLQTHIGTTFSAVAYLLQSLRKCVDVFERTLSETGGQLSRVWQAQVGAGPRAPFRAGGYTRGGVYLSARRGDAWGLLRGARGVGAY